MEHAYERTAATEARLTEIFDNPGMDDITLIKECVRRFITDMFKILSAETAKIQPKSTQFVVAFQADSLEKRPKYVFLVISLSKKEKDYNEIKAGYSFLAVVAFIIDDCKIDKRSNQLDPNVIQNEFTYYRVDDYDFAWKSGVVYCEEDKVIRSRYIFPL